MGMMDPFGGNLSKDEICERLIDAYRLDVEDHYVFFGEASGLYAGEDPLPDVLTASVRKARLYLPSSWNPSEDEPRALQMAQTHEWANIHYAVEKADINEHYKSSVAAMGLRMWTEQVTKSNLNGRLHGH
ncbi:hypothetical protein JCM8202v2_001344 [Rhodotorula sphaerocarpa]